MHKPVHIVGGGLAGSEAAWQLARAGLPVVLHEMRPLRRTDAHQGEGLAELVCSNSFRSDDADHNAVGLLHEEMRRAGSLILAAADRHKGPGGGALARAVVALVIRVEAVADPRDPQTRRLIGADREQLGLAVKTAIGVVRGVVGVFDFVTRHHAQIRPDPFCEIARVREFRSRIGL